MKLPITHDTGRPMLICGNTFAMLAPAFLHRRSARCWSGRAQLIRTFSNRLMWETTLANTPGIGRNNPGQVVRLCGHESQTASCGSHSAGNRKPRAAGGGSRLPISSGDAPRRNDRL